MKRMRAGFTAILLAASFLLTGCQLTEKDAVQMYKDSFAKSREMEKYTMTANMDMEMDFGGMSIGIVIDMDSAVADQGQTASHKMNMTVMGQEQSMEMYQQGEYLYTSVPGTDKFIKQSYEESTGMTYQGLMDLSSGPMAQSYMDAIDKAENLTFQRLDNKDVNVAFDFGQESLDSLAGEISAILEDTMLGSMESQLKSQFSGLGLPEDQIQPLVDQMMEAYRSIFSNIGVDSIRMDLTMNKNGFVTKQNVDMVITMDMSGLLTALGQEVDAATAEMLKNIKMSMNIDSVIDNINGDVTVTVPEFTEENTVTAEEATALSAA